MDHMIMTFAELAEIARIDRLRPILVRCSCCRFTAPAQDCKRIIDALLDAGDYVRDMYCSTPTATFLEKNIR